MKPSLSSPTALNASLDLAARQQLGGEVSAKIGPLLRALSLSPSALNLDDGNLAMIVAIRLFEVVTLELKELDLRIFAIEASKEPKQ